MKPGFMPSCSKAVGSREDQHDGVRRMREQGAPADVVGGGRVLEHLIEEAREQQAAEDDQEARRPGPGRKMRNRSRRSETAVEVDRVGRGDEEQEQHKPVQDEGEKT